MKAFPRGTSSVHEGMELRDYFAAKAMQAMLSTEECQLDLIDEIPVASYKIADAMMEARSK